MSHQVHYLFERIIYVPDEKTTDKAEAIQMANAFMLNLLNQIPDTQEWLAQMKITAKKSPEVVIPNDKKLL